jgi:hypothetical protein
MPMNVEGVARAWGDRFTNGIRGQLGHYWLSISNNVRIGDNLDDALAVASGGGSIAIADDNDAPLRLLVSVDNPMLSRVRLEKAAHRVLADVDSERTPKDISPLLVSYHNVPQWDLAVKHVQDNVDHPAGNRRASRAMLLTHDPIDDGVTVTDPLLCLQFRNQLFQWRPGPDGAIHNTNPYINGCAVVCPNEGNQPRKTDDEWVDYASGLLATFCDDLNDMRGLDDIDDDQPDPETGHWRAVPGVMVVVIVDPSRNAATATG